MSVEHRVSSVSSSEIARNSWCFSEEQERLRFVDTLLACAFLSRGLPSYWQTAPRISSQDTNTVQGKFPLLSQYCIC
jgi:hypothetical protein